MYDCPISLQELCVETICCNLDDVFDEYYEDIVESSQTQLNSITSNLENIVNPLKKKETTQPKKLKKYKFKQTDLFLYNIISEQILLKLGENKLLNDSTLSLFTEKNTRLRFVQLRNAEYVTTLGLQILRQHKLEELDCCGIRIHVNDIIGCLSDWSLDNLRTLNISNCTFLDSLRYSGVTSLSRLRALRRLSVAGTEFPQHGLHIVCHDLRLRSLDVSCTVLTDLAPLALLRPTLHAFTMYNHTHNKSLNLVPTLLSLDNLRYLDLSSDKDDSNSLPDLLSHIHSLPRLTYLDVSGKASLTGSVLLPWLAEHPHLAWLGVVQCAAAHEPQLTNPRQGLTVAGTATEGQLKEALKHYRESRAGYVQKCLYHLFRLTPGAGFLLPRPDVLQLVLAGMHTHASQFGVQMAATACLYNLTKGELAQRLHPGLLRHVVQLTLRAMQAFPQHYQLQKNALLTLCSDRVLQDVSFDKFLCAKLVLDSLCAFDDASMNRMAVAICSILAAKISTEQTSRLGSHPAYMRKLLAMVRAKLDQLQVDISMKFTLSALWNLTDESAGTCLVFLQEGGMPLFLEVLHAFPGDSTVETKVLGLLNNIAEVSSLRPQLLVDSFLSQLRILLQSRHIDVSYFAAGIAAHLCSEGGAQPELLAALGEAVAAWRAPDQEMVAYRSFRPFLPLLRPGAPWQVAAWATWAVHHVCTKNPKRYCSMLSLEGGVDLLQQSADSNATHPTIRHYATLVLDAVRANASEQP